MAKKVKKTSTGQSKKKAKAKPAPSQPETEPTPSDPRFVNDLLTRGEAAELDKDGKLPLPATHVIKKKNPDGSVEVRRARFKLV